MLAVNLEQLQQLINTQEKPIFIMFRTKWCKMCDVDVLLINEFENKYKDSILWVSINVDENYLWRENNNSLFQIDNVPTYSIYLDKQLVFRSNKQISNYELSAILTNLFNNIN